jgi:hypothetical protein
VGIKMPETDLTFSKEQAKQIQELSFKNPEFKKNFNLILTSWMLQKISTKNAVNLVKEELQKEQKKK